MDVKRAKRLRHRHHFKAIDVDMRRPCRYPENGLRDIFCGQGLRALIGRCGFCNVPLEPHLGEFGLAQLRLNSRHP